jgi:Protein of unknown function (DUF4054)
MMQDEFNVWVYRNDLLPLADLAALRCARPLHLTHEEFLRRLPQFESVPDDVIDDLLELCRVQFNRFVWGGFLKWAELAFVAHFLTLRENAIVAGAGDEETGLVFGSAVSAITSFSAGAVSWTRNGAIDEALMASPFAGTTWGQMFLYLKKRLAVGLVMVT